MASAAGMPATMPEESTPLLGRPGPIKQPEDSSLALNFVSGWAPLALLSALGLVILALVTTLQKSPFILFLYHPVLQTLFVFFLTMSILVLQPTHTPAQKVVGQKAHAALMLLALLCLSGGVGVIEYNKIANNGLHFHSVHGWLGVIGAALFGLQYVSGVTMLNVPALYGGEAKARSVWKYHRRSGYVLFMGFLTTVAAAGDTDYVKANLFGIVPPLVLGLGIAIGVYSRVRKEKLGL